MLVEFACFAAGCAAGGYFVFRGMCAAILKDLQKRPWTEEEKEARAQLLVEAATLSMQKDNPAAIRRSKELQHRLVNDDARRGAIGEVQIDYSTARRRFVKSSLSHLAPTAWHRGGYPIPPNPSRCADGGDSMAFRPLPNPCLPPAIFHNPVMRCEPRAMDLAPGRGPCRSRRHRA
jgi:hypothetical protein